MKTPAVLLVEDEPIVQKVHTMLLTKLGCKVDLAENGQQALHKFKNNYALVFMDIGLPDMRGTEVSAKIRSAELDENHIPIVALTAFSEPEIEALCKKSGINAVYGKPLTVNQFKEILQKYVF